MIPDKEELASREVFYLSLFTPQQLAEIRRNPCTLKQKYAETKRYINYLKSLKTE